MTKQPRRPSDRELRVAADAARSLRGDCVEAGWPSPQVTVRVAMIGYDRGGATWVCGFFRASYGGQHMERGFALRSFRTADQVDVAVFDRILEEAGLACKSTTKQ